MVVAVVVTNLSRRAFLPVHATRYGPAVPASKRFGLGRMQINFLSSVSAALYSPDARTVAHFLCAVAPAAGLVV